MTTSNCYAGLVGGPLDSPLLDITGVTPNEVDTGVALATELEQFGAGGWAMHDPRSGDPDRWEWTGDTAWPAPAHSPASPARGMLGGVSSAPIVVHRPSLSGGRRVTVHSHGQDKILGTAYSDHDLVVFLEGSGVADAEAILDDPEWVEWRGGHPHEFHAA